MSLMDKKLLTTKEVAEVLFVSPQAVRKWCKGKFLKTYRTMGGQYRIRPKDVIEFTKKYEMWYEGKDECREAIKIEEIGKS